MMMESNLDLPVPQLPSMSNDTEPFQVADIAAGNIKSLPLHVSDTESSMIDAPPDLSELIYASVGEAEFASTPLPVDVPVGGQPKENAPNPLTARALDEQASRYNPAIIAASATDPMNRLKLEQLQAETGKLLLTTIDEVYAMLVPDQTTPRASLSLTSGPTSIRNLMAEQRRGEIMSTSRREIAEGIVIGSLLNVDNPQWNPTDPATCNESSSSILAAVLQLDL